MSLRIGFDMDGVFADFVSAFQEVELRLFGDPTPSRADDPEQEEEAERKAAAPADAATEPREMRRRHDAIWNTIRSTPDFWTTLKPLDEGAVRRLHELMLRYRWEVFFMTQRPETTGETVQRQTQRWLVTQGFDLPTVLVLAGGRGAVASALRLDYHVDDHPQHCIDVVSESHARPILIMRERDESTVAKARKLGIAAAASIGECLEVLEQATVARDQPGLLGRFAAMVGWK